MCIYDVPDDKILRQLLPETVGRGIVQNSPTYKKTIQSPSVSDTAKFVKVMDMWPDICNPRVLLL